MYASNILQTELERIMGGALPGGAYGGTQVVVTPVTGGTGSEGSSGSSSSSSSGSGSIEISDIGLGTFIAGINYMPWQDMGGDNSIFLGFGNGDLSLTMWEVDNNFMIAGYENPELEMWIEETIESLTDGLKLTVEFAGFHYTLIFDATNGKYIQFIEGMNENDSIKAAGVLSGKGGNDHLIGLSTNDTLLGGEGDDVLVGGAGADQLVGGAGEDWVSYADAAQGVSLSLADGRGYVGSLNGGAEANGDTYHSIENVEGSNGGDVLTGNAGNNLLRGLGSDDILNGGEGADGLNGGAGFDWASYINSKTGVVADLANRSANTGEAAGDYYNWIEGLQGSNHGDTLAGDSIGNALSGLNGNDVLAGRGGNDHLNGGAGDDILQGGAGADMLIGGGDFDWASYADATAGVTADLSNSSLNIGDAAGDTYVDIRGLQGSNHNDVLTGDTTTLGNALSGLDGDDALIGQAGNDHLHGGAGSDVLYGNGANDILIGDLGNDQLIGGAGADYLTGGAGRDVFRFDCTLGSGNVDTIADFSTAEGDRIELETHVFRAFPDVVYEVDDGYVLNANLKSAAFSIGAAATSSSHRIIYNSSTGALFYDADGTGASAQVQFAQLKAGLALSAANFGLYTL
ncbi:calcium-binding protein [Microvirga terrestris]|uniref:Calcium-binding protein n=1 Tax=Microvirga terrestris TaxID=2791024 RepID=A0ABS0HPA2_9HYPH|nr:calcium-binding protein [Microvirga terrestris]MBF9195062.1 calcium-binding protein [Microvirga terrestris]